MGALPPAAVAFVCAVQLVKLWLAAVLPLFGDEAFYLFEGRYFSPAYDDVPLLTPWSLALAEQLFGSGLLALRLPFLLLSWTTLRLLWVIARDAWDAHIAWRAVALACLPPILAMNGVMALPDVGINLAVVLCLRALQQAQHGAPSAGLLLATGLAVGWWSHYRFVLPLCAAGLWMLVDPVLRPLLLNRSLQRGAVLGLVAGLAPLVWHAAQAEGGGFVFQFHERHPWDFQPRLLLDPLLQALAVGPVLYLMQLGEGVRRLRAAPDFARLAAGLGLGLLLLLWLLGPWADSERSRLHWPTPAYLALLLPLAAAWESWARGWRLAAVLPGLLLCLGGAGYLAAAALAPDRLAGTRLYPHNFAGWQTMAEEVSRALDTLPPDTVVIADHVTLAAQLDRSLRGRTTVYSLDHPLNHKHGRAAELARRGRDEAAVTRIPHTPKLIVVELSASRLRDRAAWLQRLCAVFPDARWIGEQQIGHGEKRLVLLLDDGPRPGVCGTAVLAYFDLAEGTAVVQRGATITGWALAAGSGVQALRFRVGDQHAELDYGIPLPSLQAHLGNTGDPAFPQVGFRGTLPAGLPPGRHWLWLQARVPGRAWQDVASHPLELQAQ